jgi:glutaredoxin
MATLTLLSKPGCHLCDDAREILRRLADRYPVRLVERDITESAEDLAAYGEWIPVVLLDGEQQSVFRVDASALEAELRRRTANPG